MKKTIRRVCFACLILTVLLLTGCGGSFFAEEDLQIVSVEAEPTNDGYTKLIITYSDESDREPDVFAIPDGAQGTEGAKGTGISKISYEHDDENRQTGITLEFTDATLAPVSFDIPDGLSVVDIVPYEDSVLGKCVIFKYSDKSQSEPYQLPKGDTGNGITSFSCVQNDQDKSVTIDVVMDDGRDPIHVFIPGPKEGRGVAEMIGGESGSNYYVEVKYTDGTGQKILFSRPAKWLNGTTQPALSEGEVGDYFFDTSHDKIYLKEEYEGGIVEWKEIVGFEKETYTVEFDLNDEGDATFLIGSDGPFTVERGSYFSENGFGEIPIPKRDGYTFVGWYRQKQVYEPTMSRFTDLTPIFSDLKLYAIWEANS